MANPSSVIGYRGWRYRTQGEDASGNRAVLQVWFNDPQHAATGLMTGPVATFGNDGGTTRGFTVHQDGITITAGGLTVTAGGIALNGGNLTIADDLLLGIGTGDTARFSWETVDANANALLLQMPAGGAVDVPVLAIGQSIENVDLGLFNGVVDPNVALFGVGAVTTGTRLRAYKARGTITAPTVVTTGDDLFSIDAYGAVAAGEYVQAARILFEMTGTIATTRGPGVITFQTATDAAPSVLTTALTIGANQASTFAGAIIGAATQALLNTVSTTVNFAGAATTVTVGAAASVTTWTGQSISITGANSTSNTTVTVTNSSNAAAASHSILDVAVGGITSTGDPQLRLTIPGGDSWYAGLDNSDSDQFYIGLGTLVGTTPRLMIRADTSPNTHVSFTLTPHAATMGNTATFASTIVGIAAITSTHSGVAERTVLHYMLQVGVLTIAQSGGAVTVTNATGISSVSPTAGALVSLTHSSAFRSLTGGAAVNASGFYGENQTAGTSRNVQFMLATGQAAPAVLTDLAQVFVNDIGAGDARLGIVAEVGSAIYFGSDRLRFAAATGGISIGATDILTSTATLVTVPVDALFSLGVRIGVDSGNNEIDDATQGAASTTLFIGNASINVTSDMRVKENFADYAGGLALIRRLHVQEFDQINLKPFGGYDGRYVGFTAQHLFGVTPWAVNTQGGAACLECRAGLPCGQHLLWQVRQEFLVGPVVQAIQEIDDEVVKIKLQIEFLQERLVALEQ